MTPFVFALLFYAMLKSAAVTPSSRIFRSMCVSLDMTGMSLGLTAMVNVLRVNYIGLVMQIQLPGIE